MKRKTSVGHLSPEIRAYIAAFLDCDGSVSVRIAKRPHRSRGTYEVCVIALYFTNTNRQALEFLKTAIGAGFIKSQRRPSAKWRTAYHLTIAPAVDIYALLLQIRPYLQIKHYQANLLLEISRKRLDGNLQHPVTERDREIAGKMKLLNKRGR